ncbi:aconitate hydratase [Agaricicola taiwanensis]|uniref:Aconitate hydratase n=1 Tax=Agaricicola taiwanensis TaxID=591372 RepID=A0A8J3DWV5_9RHOB|nr:aconitate hydratase AcnA [Agaricicola taiwanensis]GGE47412.1 aconitate hydratase [Agaricicola taiwanensis]
MHDTIDTGAARRELAVGGKSYTYFALETLTGAEGVDLNRLPISLKILLENLLRHQDGEVVTSEDIMALARGGGSDAKEIAYFPTRIVMPDSSGIPLLADLSAMRDAILARGGDPELINPAIPVDLVVDHSVTAEFFGSRAALQRNMDEEYAANRERYEFVKWAAQAYRNLRVVPPGMGIVHQVNLEYLSRPIWHEMKAGKALAYPDTLVGLDSHTPMINALGVLGWGVGGIEAASAMLGEPIMMPVPEVLGCHLVGQRAPGVTSTDIVLAVTQRLRQKGVTGKLVEFIGEAARRLSLADRATIANMAPEYGANMGFFPIDDETLRYLRMTGRDEDSVLLAEAYAKAQGMWADHAATAVYTDTLEIDISEVRPSMAGPKRPQDRRALAEVASSFAEAFPKPATSGDARPGHGDIVIASITSCTNTSNPSVMLAAGLLARNARARGLQAKPWVKTSFSPGSRVVADYMAEAGLQPALDELGFHIVGYGCMTCAGASGSLPAEITEAMAANNATAVAVLSGNRNFEGRIHPAVKAAYIGSPPLVIAYALAGTIDIDIERDVLGHASDGTPVTLADIWPSDAEVSDHIARFVAPSMFRDSYASIFGGDGNWAALHGRQGGTYQWDDTSTYLRRPPFFDGAAEPKAETIDIRGARALLMLGDSITTDHISPVGPIQKDSPAGLYLRERGLQPAELHSFLARRVNHDVMIRGTFDNPRLRNEMVPGMEGGMTRLVPGGDIVPVPSAADHYAAADTPLIVIAGREYGTGSSRDWAAKGTRLLGIKAVVAESFERIHRSNLVGMGVLPLQFPEGVTRSSLGLDGQESYDLVLPGGKLVPRGQVRLIIHGPSGRKDVDLLCRLDTEREVEWYVAGGVLHYVLDKISASGVRLSA